MWRAVEAVEERLIRSTAALDAAVIPYAVIGAHAVAYWVAQADSGAVRNTPNVDILIRRDDLSNAVAALEGAGFARAPSPGPRTDFLDGHQGRARDAVQVWCCGDVIKPGTEPLPDVTDSVPGQRFRVVSLETLVRMKLSASRTIDKVHIRDLIGVGLIDETWPDKFPEVLAEWLRQILANPDG
jgi:hypothetical protein